MTQTNPILSAIENLGGTASIAQISSATAIKRVVLQDQMADLLSAGAVEKVGGSIWRIQPEKLTAASQALRPAHVLEREKAAAVAADKATGNRQRKAPVSDRILAAIENLGGVATTNQICALTGLKSSQVSDGCYKLKRSKTVKMTSPGHYVIPGFKTPVDYVQLVEARAAIEPALEPEEASEAPVEPSEADLVADALCILLPSEEIDLDPKLLRAVAKWIEASERVLKLSA